MSSHQNGRSLRVLVDMDCVLCDFEGHFLKTFRDNHPDDPFIPLESRNTLWVADQYGKIDRQLKGKCRRIVNSEGFFRNLPPIDGAIDAMKQMSEMNGVEVFICTSPLTSRPHSVTEKFEWVQEHLGQDWTGRMIVTKDKTMAYGDILIDDRPNVTGVVKRPSWDHVLFTACHNKHLQLESMPAYVTGRLDCWTDDAWVRLMEEYLKTLQENHLTATVDSA